VHYVLALSERADGGGKLEPLQGFMTNPAGSAIVNAVGPIRQIVQGEADTPRRYLVIAAGSATGPFDRRRTDRARCRLHSSLRY
jgi:hypothetical protein